MEDPVSINDHCMISFNLTLLCDKIKPYHRQMSLFNKTDFKMFKDNHRDSDFKLEPDIEQSCKKCTTFLKVANQSIPNKLVLI